MRISWTDSIIPCSALRGLSAGPGAANSVIENPAKADSLDILDPTLLIEKVAFGGAGIARLPDGRVCFVPLTIPGERVEVRVVREKKSYVEAELVSITTPSPDRIEPRCEIFGKCGGCSYQHMAYAQQLDIKTSQVREVLARVAGLRKANVLPMLASPLEWHYRNRISVHARGGIVGFHGRASHNLVPASACPIASLDINQQLAHLSANPPREDIRITLREKTTYHGFSQVNPAAAELLAKAVAAFAGSGDLLVDAYCGAGFFSKRLPFKRIIGIEWSTGAVRAAAATAGEDETYLAGAVELHLPAVLAAGLPTLLLLDPPAEGLSPEVLHAISTHRPPRIVYVSCDPSTLARDIKKLSYCLEAVQPVDMFPQTSEIESVALLSPPP